MTIKEYFVDAWQLFITCIAGVALYVVVDAVTTFLFLPEINIYNFDPTSSTAPQIDTQNALVFTLVQWLNVIAFTLYLDAKFHHRSIDIGAIFKQTLKTVIPLIILLFITVMIMTFVIALPYIFAYSLAGGESFAMLVALVLGAYFIYRLFLLFLVAIFEGVLHSWKNCWELSKNKDYFKQFMYCSVVMTGYVLITVLALVLLKDIAPIMQIINSVCGAMILILTYRFYRALREKAEVSTSSDLA